MTVPIAHITNLVAVGAAKEVAFGTPVDPTFWVPSNSIGIEREPNVILPELFHYSRAAYTVAIDGIQKVSGPWSFPLYPDSGNAILFGALGHDVVTHPSNYLHTAVLDKDLPSFSIVKLMDTLPIQYFGCKILKAGFKFSTNGEAEATYDIEAQRAEVYGSLPTPLFGTDVGFGPTGVALNIGAGPDVSCTSADITIDNGGKPYPTLWGHDYPALVMPGTRKVSFKTTVFLQGLVGGAAATPQGYFQDLIATGQLKTLTAISVTATQGVNVHTFTLPAAVLVKYSNPFRMGDVVMSDLEYEATVGGIGNIDFQYSLANTISTAY